MARRPEKLITYKGKTQTISEWAKETGISRWVIYKRITYLKWSPQRALTEEKHVTPILPKMLTVGNQTHTINEWSKISGVHRSTIHFRLYQGWNLERAIYVPAAKAVEKVNEREISRTVFDLFRKFLSSERMRTYRTVGKIYQRLQREGLMQVA
jgi:hypothetical protein